MLVLLNALNQPYRQNTEILTSLQKDGIKFYVVSSAYHYVGNCSSMYTGTNRFDFMVVVALFHIDRVFF